MFIDFNQDLDWLGTLIDDVQMHGTTTITLGQLGLLKRCVLALIAVQHLENLGEKNVSSEEFEAQALTFINSFLAEAGKTV